MSGKFLMTLRQLRTVARSLTASATSTLIHAFVTDRLDYSCSPYAGLPAGRLWCLDRILRSAAPLLAAFPNLVTSLDTCLTFSIGSPLNSVSHTKYLPWSGAPF